MKCFAKSFSLLALLSLLSVTGTSQGHVYTKVAPSGPDWTTTSILWVDIQDLDLWFYQYDAGNACIGISAESNVTAGKRMFVRALVDGVPASPSDVVFASEAVSFCRQFQFAANIPAGIHRVTFQATVDDGGTAYFGDRTMWVITAPTLANIIAAPSGAVVTTNKSGWEDIPNMSLNLTLPASGPLILTFSGEIFCSDGKRTFLRAVVDGIAASPSDVIIATSFVAGVHGMTFVVPSVSAGNHSAKFQWMVDAGGTAFVGDRTMAVVASDPVLLAAGRGGVLSTSPPSGPDVATTSAGYSDIPGLAIDMPVPENGTLVIAIQSEVEVTGGRMFVRVTIDGSPCSPSDAGLTYQSGFSGTYGMTFVQKNVPGGIRHVVFQWHVDGGQTGFLGDRNMTVLALPGDNPDLTNGFQSVKPALGTFPVLVILWDPQRTTDPAPSVGAVTNLIYGNQPSVADYFKVNSGNNAAIGNAGILGWLPADKPASFYWAAYDSTDADHDGFTSGHVRKWWEAVTKASVSFDFASYDVNFDGVLDPTELGIVIVIPQNGPFGSIRTPGSQQYPTWAPLIVDGVRIPLIAEVYAGSPPNLGVFAHELSHLLFKLPDMYFDFFFPYAAGHYSLMDVTYIDSHLDPFHKINLGWMQPTIVRQNGRYALTPAETGGGAYILMDPHHGEKEYFIVENRQRSLKYDTQLADSGLAVWHVITDPAVYGALPAPAGVAAQDWASVPANDWGRRAVRLIRPVYGPPFENNKALWDGADPVTGYDLLSSDPNSSHARLRWIDGTPSGFAVRQFSPATGGVMEATFELPATATEIAEESIVPKDARLQQNFPNPFNPTTVIRYRVGGVSGQGAGLGEQGLDVSVKVFDVLGREVAVLVSEQKPPGMYEVQFDGSRLASGMYVYRLVAGEYRESRKMMLMK